MRFNLIVTNAGRDTHLPAFLHYLGQANANRRFDVALYLVEPADAVPAPLIADPPGITLHRLRGPAAGSAGFNKAALLNAAIAAMGAGWNWCGLLDIDMLYAPTILDTVAGIHGASYIMMTGCGLGAAHTTEALAQLPPYSELFARGCSPFNSCSQICFSPAWLSRFREIFGRTDLFDERFVGWGYQDHLPDVAANLLARARLAGKALIERVWLHLAHSSRPDPAQTDRNLALVCTLHAELRIQMRAYLRQHGPPRAALPHLDRGGALLRAGHPAAAERELYQALQLEPTATDVAQLLAVALSTRGAYDEAAALLRKAVQRDPGDPELWLNLGEVLRRQGRLAEARAALVESLRLDAYVPEVNFNLGTLCSQAGRPDEAVQYLHRATRMRPGYAAAHYNLGNALRALGRPAEAAGAYAAALRARPGYAEAHLNLGAVQLELEQPAAAAAHYGRAAAIKPEMAAAHRNLWQLYESQGRLEEARVAGERALALEPANALLRLSLETMLPPIMPEVATIDQARAALAASIARRSPGGVQLDRERGGESGGAPPFTLIYHGRDDRDLKAAYAGLFAGSFPDEPPRPAPGSPRIGFVVTAGHEGVFLKCMAGIVEALPAPLRPVIVCGGLPGARVMRAALRRREIEFLVLPPRLAAAAAALRQARLSLLYFWEVGTDALNYFLPFCRTAPLQCTGWGWPITSGIPAIDYFLSCRELEPPGAESSYTEQLVRLPGLPTSYARPPVPTSPPPRAWYGFDERDHLYVCAQNLRKVHPDFDPLVAAILRRDPRAMVVFLADRVPALSELLKRRLRVTMPDVAGRVQVLPRLDEASYLGLLTHADVVLDTVHYGGGANTCYDAAAAGAPVVTMPGAFHRGRWAAAVAAALGVDDGVAASPEDYIVRALALGGDRGYRDAVSRRILAAAPGLFGRDEPARELGACFLSVIG